MQVNGFDFTIGADPEIFIERDGKPHSAFGLIEGTKTQPQPVEHGAIQVDGMALEFNIEPVSTKEDWRKRLEYVSHQMMLRVPEFRIHKAASVNFDEEYMRNAPREALLLGCEPDFNGQTGLQNHAPPQHETLRTAGGHVHIGGFPTSDVLEPSHFENCCKLARFMDEQVGVYSVLWDKDDQRRQMYGQATCFRPKKYGMEYRTMSNAWLFNPAITELVYDFTKDALERMFDEDDEVDDQVYSIINNSERDHQFFKHNPKAEMVLDVL